MLTAVGYAKLQVVVDACSIEPRGPPITAAEHSHAVILQQALHHIPNHSTEFTTRNIAIRLGQQLADKVQHGCNNYATLHPHYNAPHYDAVFNITRPCHGSQVDYFAICLQ